MFVWRRYLPGLGGVFETKGQAAGEAQEDGNELAHGNFTPRGMRVFRVGKQAGLARIPGDGVFLH